MERNKLLNIKILRELKYLYFVFMVFIAITFIFFAQYLFITVLMVGLGIYIVILEAFEKDIKLLRLKGKGVEVAIEMAEVKERLKEKAESLSKTIENKEHGEKEGLEKEKIQELIQKNLDETFAWGLKVGGYKPFTEIKGVKIIKDKDGNEGVTWGEN